MMKTFYETSEIGHQLAAPLKEGQKVQFGFSNAESILSQADVIASSLIKKPAEAALAPEGFTKIITGKRELNTDFMIFLIACS